MIVHYRYILVSRWYRYSHYRRDDTGDAQPDATGDAQVARKRRPTRQAEGGFISNMCAEMPTSQGLLCLVIRPGFVCCIENTSMLNLLSSYEAPHSSVLVGAALSYSVVQLCQ